MSEALSRLMRCRLPRFIGPLCAALILFGAGSAFGDDDDDDARDHELARQALIEGRIRPLAEITEAFNAKMAGEIMGVELEVEKQGGFVYEFKILTPEGKLKEVDVDAKSGDILKVEDDH